MRWNRSEPKVWCLLSVTIGCLVAATPARDEEAQRPNVIVLLADDLAPRILGFDGNREIRTPHLDRLASQGLTFDRAYVPLAQCGPSRAALMTGRYPHRLGVMTNEGAVLPRGAPSIARRFTNAGYRCGFVGKWDLGGALSPRGGFDAFWRPLANSRSYEDASVSVDGKALGFEGWLPDGLVDLGIEFIQSGGDEPFFLWISFKTPHEPLTQPPDESLAYAAAELPLPESADDDLSGKPALQRTTSMHLGYVREGPDGVREKRAVYYAMVSALDRAVGRLVAHLGEAGLSEDTLIVFLSDNGWLLGEHQMLAKGPALYEELVRTPMFLHWPARVPAGARSSALVSSLDLFPTLTALLGQTAEHADGSDLWPLVDGSVDRVRDELYLEYWKRRKSDEPTPILGVVTSSAKYVRYLATTDEELYDLARDPHETANLAGDPGHAQERERLRKLVDRHAASIQKPFW